MSQGRFEQEKQCICVLGSVLGSVLGEQESRDTDKENRNFFVGFVYASEQVLD